MQTAKQHSFFLNSINFAFWWYRIFNLNCFNTVSDFTPVNAKVCEKINPSSSAFHRFCGYQPPSRPLKVVYNVEINSASEHCRYDKIWFKCLCVMSNIKVTAVQDIQTDKHNLFHRSIWYTLRLKKKKKKKTCTHWHRGTSWQLA